MGMFRVANPNTHPDGLWPYPPHAPDGINDYNGLDATPWINRDWDLNTFDPQGNVDLTYEIEAQFEFTSGPVDPTSEISFDSPLWSSLNLAVAESQLVYMRYVDAPDGELRGCREGVRGHPARHPQPERLLGR